MIVDTASFYDLLGLALMGLAVIKNSKNARTMFGVGAIIVVLNQLVDVYHLWENFIGSGSLFIDVLSSWFSSMYNFLLPLVTVLTFVMFALSGLLRFNKIIAWIAIVMDIVYLAALCVSIYLWNPISYYYPYAFWDLGLLLLSVSNIMYLLQELKANRIIESR